MTPLTPLQLYSIMRKAGFPASLFVSPGVSVAVCMTAIALRESSGVPTAFNGNTKTGDRSYGLLQINMLDPNVNHFLKAKIPAVAADEKALLDPNTNAQAGFLLYGGRISNINLAWYINHGDDYTTRYQSHLPAAQTAEPAFNKSAASLASAPVPQSDPPVR